MDSEKSNVDKIMKKIALCGFIILCHAFAGAKVMRLPDYARNDPFLNPAYHSATDGTAQFTVSNGEQAIEATFISVLPPEVIINRYKEYIVSQGGLITDDLEEMCEKDRTWLWRGELHDEKKYVAVYYEKKEKRFLTSIKLISSVKRNSLQNSFDSIFDSYPELASIKNALIHSRNVYQEKMMSSVLIFDVPGTPEAALRQIRNRFIEHGWSDHVQGISHNYSDKLCFLARKHEYVSLTAARDDGQTTLIITIRKSGMMR